MNKRLIKRILGLVILLVSVALLAWLAGNLIRKRGKSDAGSFDFAIQDTTAISAIEIQDAFGKKITLNKSDGTWKDEKGKCVAAPNISLILDAAKNIEFKGYLGDHSKNKLVNLMSTQHVRVRFFIDGEWEKTWYIGPPSQDHYGQIMLLETSDDGKSKEPVMMRIKGFKGFISPRFFADRKKWMCTSLFSFTQDQIGSVEVINNEKPKLSFTIQSRGKRFVVTSQGKPLPFLDTANVYRYLQEYRNIHFNMVNMELDKRQCDSVLRSPVYCQLAVKPKSGKAINLRFFRIKSNEPQRNEAGEMENWDMNMLWAAFPSGELVKCQYHVFNPLLLGHIYFPGIMELK